MQYLPNYLPNHVSSRNQTYNQSLAIRSAHRNWFYFPIFHSQKKHDVGEKLLTCSKLLTPNFKFGFSYIGTKHLIYGQFASELVPLSCSRWITETVHTSRAKKNNLFASSNNLSHTKKERSCSNSVFQVVYFSIQIFRNVFENRKQCLWFSNIS